MLSSLVGKRIFSVNVGLLQPEIVEEHSLHCCEFNIEFYQIFALSCFVANEQSIKETIATRQIHKIQISIAQMWWPGINEFICFQ